MNTITAFQDSFDTNYKNIYADLERRYESFKIANAEWTEQKMWNQFLLKISFVRDYELLCWKEPHQMEASTFKVLKNPFKMELKEIFEFKEVTYTEDFINNFVKHDIPQLRKEHLQKLQSGHRDYQWDNEFIQRATDEDILNLLATYYAHTDFMEMMHPDYDKSTAKKQRVVMDDELQSSAKWIKNQEEFVMLFSILYDTGTIGDVQGLGKIKTMEAIAKDFDLELSEGWQNNINSSSTDTPEFVLKIMEKFNRAMQS